jgi:redox-sensing transcriptional repressor
VIKVKQPRRSSEKHYYIQTYLFVPVQLSSGGIFMIEIPKPTLGRLPLYYRALVAADDSGVEILSSAELGESAGVDSAQVRKDLTYFGQFGRPGVGYNVRTLLLELERILGLKNPNEAVLVGAGRLGMAICNYPGFSSYGLRIVAMFDVDPAKIDLQRDGLKVFPLDRLERIVGKLGIQIGIITTPAASAQRVANRLVASGVKAIWNFAPVNLKVPPGIILRNEDLAVGLATLSHYLSGKK